MQGAAVARIVALEQAIDSLGEVSRSTRVWIARLTAPLELAVSQVLRAGQAVATLSRNINEFLLPPIEFATKQIGSLATGTAAYGAEILRAAELTQLGVERYQELRYAAGQAGVAQGSLTEALVNLNQAARSARSGNDELIGRFAALGLSAEELQGLAPDQLFLRVIDALRQIGDPALQREIGSALLGGVAPQLARLVEDGSAGVEQSARQARDLGTVLSAEAIAQAQSFKTQLDQLNTSLNGLALTIGSQLLPVLQPLIDKLTLWISANRDLIATKVEEVVSKIVDAILGIDFDRLFAAIVKVVDGVAALIDGMGGGEIALATLLGLLSGDKGLATLAVLGAGASAFWKKIAGEPSALEEAMESAAELLQALQENRTKYATASPTERKILDREFHRKSLEMQNVLDVIDTEISKIPTTIRPHHRSINQDPVPNPERQKLDHDSQVLRHEFGKLPPPQRAEPQETRPPKTTRSTGNEGAAIVDSADTRQFKGALDIYVHVDGTPTKVSVVERPGSNFNIIRADLGPNLVGTDWR